MNKAIDVKNIFKRYKLYNSDKERLGDLLTPKSFGEDFYALTDVTFEVEKGDVVGFIGINGSGKSTLSNIIAGIVPESSGTVDVDGQTSLIAVASGLKGDLTGRDNIELKLLMLGFDKDAIKRLEPDIIEFSEIGNFIDQPVKSYSSGMKSRLGFAISVNVDPDILIIDEALSVGDKAFAEKSYNKMMDFKELGKTMIFVSHSLGQMKKFCEKILWLEFGRVRDFGTVDEVIPKYEEFLSFWKKLTHNERETYKQRVMDGHFPDEWFSDDKEIDNDIKPPIYKEEPISRVGHIRGGKSYIYSTPGNIEGEFVGESSDMYKNAVYYIKKQATYYDEVFYLLSSNPSAQEGVIGWMKASDVSSHLHVPIDSDRKEFKIKGSGEGYNRPWGGRKNLIFNDLKPFEEAEFNVNKTEKIGNNIWYRGILNGKEMWIHFSHIKD
ncbi:teichoic acids export ABC transporter ATP-binding subunit TagH [Virgibacillus doumboii]|uniref:teichoic acids export ABC transporter ATP-binding subunit TagH n=1 Tax=Virgibacillus doumboii TaxID=2697503 RepID=UPI0013DFD40B